MPAHRQAALLLHGLSRADQHWILARIDPADARVLRGHLRELRELGIPADPALVPSAAPTTTATADAEPHAVVVARASAAGLQLALDEEPAWLVAQLLALRAWPWRTAFLDGLAAERRAAILAAAPGTLAPRAEAALLAALAGRLAGSAQPALPGAVWNKLRRRA